ncbi:MAG: hypothetical protein ACRC2O_02605 [Chitinophagaceae bacterium]
MLIFGGFLSGTLLPWVIFAPVLPLMVAMIKRPPLNNTNISLLFVCVVTLLTNIFSLFIKDELPLNSSFFTFAVLVEFIFSLLLLKSCTNNELMKRIIYTSGLVFTGIFITFMILKGSDAHYSGLIKIGYSLMFVLSLSVIVTLLENIKHYLTASPSFWISAGLFFQFGLVSLLLLLNNGVNPEKLSSDEVFGMMYAFITCIKFVFFSIGILIDKKL